MTGWGMGAFSVATAACAATWPLQSGVQAGIRLCRALIPPDCESGARAVTRAVARTCAAPEPSQCVLSGPTSLRLEKVFDPMQPVVDLPEDGKDRHPGQHNHPDQRPKLPRNHWTAPDPVFSVIGSIPGSGRESP